MSEDIWEKFEKLLSQHDWYYQYTDSYEIWARGKDEKDEIVHTMKYLESIDKERVKNLYKKFCPLKGR